MQKIDGWIITILERSCHKLQRLTGVRSAHVANALYILATCWLIQSAFVEGHKTTLYFGPILVVGFFLYSRKTLNRKPDSSVGEATANPLKVDEFEIFWRVSGLLLASLTFFIDWETKIFWYESAVLAAYCSACDDLPIAPSKLKEWLGSFKHQPELQPVESEC